MLTVDVYDLIMTLPVRNATTPSSALPSNGIYLFYEDGEQCELRGRLAPRIVRVGTHRVDGRFPGRIRNHVGAVRTLGGNKNTSVFRRHLGGALLRRDDPSDQRLPEWTKQGGETFREVEVQVSRYLRDKTRFVCFRVDRSDERLGLESGLIALLAQRPFGVPSSSWLGRYATSADIRESGLWNTNHVRDIPLTADQFRRLVELVGAMNDESDAGMNVLSRPVSLPDDAPTSDSTPTSRIGSDAVSASFPTADDDTEQRTLVIVPCGSAKVWDKKPMAGPTIARDAYTGPPFVVHRQYAERFGHDWVILSAKYGFIAPDVPIPEPYNVSFKYKRTNPVGVEALRAQITDQELDRYDRVIVLGGKDYVEPAKRAFGDMDVELHFPFLGLPIGRMMSAVQRSISTGCPIPLQKNHRDG